MAQPIWNASTKSYRDSLGRFVKGNIPFDRTGIPHTEETRKKLRKARAGRTPNKPIEMAGKKFNRWMVIRQSGRIGKQYAWLCECDCGTRKRVAGHSLRNNISKSCGCLTSERMVRLNKENSGEKNYWYGKVGYFKGVKRPEHGAIMSGANNPNWRGGIKPINRKIRDSIEYREWRIAVFKRDNFVCQECGQVGRDLNADHIKPFSKYPELRFDVDNGRTLCLDCHRKTETWGGRVMYG